MIFLGRGVLLSLLLGSASAHTNAVGVVRNILSSTNRIDITFFYGTYHEYSPQEGALALYGHDGIGSVASAASYTTLLYGANGAEGDSTYVLQSATNVGGIDWTLTTRTSADSWNRAFLTEVGFSVGVDYLFDETSSVYIFSHQQATINLPCAAAGTRVKYRPDFDAAPVGATAKASLSVNYAPCTFLDSYPDCGNFDMAELLIEVDSSCNVNLVGVVTGAPSLPPPPPCFPDPVGATVTCSNSSAPVPVVVAVAQEETTVFAEDGSSTTQTVPSYVGNVAAPQPLKSRSQCCKRDEIGASACPWELECVCCIPDNPWTGEPSTAPFWDPVVGQFRMDARCDRSDVPACPCCLVPKDADVDLEQRCPPEWRCRPPPPAAVAPILPIAIGAGVAAMVLMIAFTPRNRKLHGVVKDDLGNPIAGAKVHFTDVQAKVKKFKAETTTDFRGRYHLNVRPAAKGGLSVAMDGYQDDGGGSKQVELPSKRSEKKSKVAPEGQQKDPGHQDLALVAPRLLSGMVMSDNGVSKVQLAGATVSVTKQSPPQSGSPSKLRLNSPLRGQSFRSPSSSYLVPGASPPPSPPSTPGGAQTRVAFDEELNVDASPPKSPLKPPPKSPLRALPLAKKGSFASLSPARKTKPSTADNEVASIQTEDVATAGAPNFKVELPPGDYNILFSAPGHSSKSESVTLGNKGEPKETNLNVTLVPRRYTFSGKVLTSILAYGAVDPKVAPEAHDTPTGDEASPSTGSQILVGAKVTIMDGNGETIKTLVSDDGGFFILSLPAGSYTRRVECEGYNTKFDRVDISEDDLVLNAHLDVLMCDLIGTVRSSSLASHAIDDIDQPLPHAMVCLKDASSEVVVATAVSSELGKYSLAAPPGAYTLGATARGHNPVAADPVHLKEDDQVHDVTLAVTLFTLDGIVLDAENDTPLPTASVELIGDHGDFTLNILSGQSGGFQFALPDPFANLHLRPKPTLVETLKESTLVSKTTTISGAYSHLKFHQIAEEFSTKLKGHGRKWLRRVTMQGYVTDETRYVLKADTSETIRLVKAQFHINGTLFGPDGEPLAGVRIELLDAQGEVVTTITTDANGAYTMATCQGEFTWSVEADGYLPISRKITVADDTSADATLEPITHKITGLVTGGEAASKLGGVAVKITPDPREDEPAPFISPKEASCLTNANGSFEVTDVLPGRYAIAFTADADYDSGSLKVVVPDADVHAEINLVLKTYTVQGRITEAFGGDPIPFAAVELLDKKKKVTQKISADEQGLYTFSNLLPGEKTIQASSGGFILKTHTFTMAKEDVAAGEGADVALDAIQFSLSGCVMSDEDSNPPVPGAIVWLKKNGKIKQRVVCNDKGIYSCGQIPGGLYSVVAGAPLYEKMRGIVVLENDVVPGGEADLCMPKPLPPEADIGCALAEFVTPLKSIFQHYSSAAIVGEDNPFQMAFFQLEAFMADLKLPEGLSKTQPSHPKIAELFDDANGPSKTSFRIDQKGDVAGALRVDPTKCADRILTFDEFLDYQVRMAWLCGQRGYLSLRAFPHSRRGLGFALKLYVEEILIPRAERLEVDPVFEAELKKFKMPQAIAKSITKAFDEQPGASTAKMITVDQWIKIIKKWRAVGNTMSIIKCRTLYVQYADDDRGRVPFYIKDILPAEATVAKESDDAFEEEEDDDVMEAKAAAAQAAKAASEGSKGDGDAETTEPEEKDGLAVLEDVRKPRATDQEMTLAEMKAAVCRLAQVLCKGKTLSDRLEAFASMHIK